MNGTCHETLVRSGLKSAEGLIKKCNTVDTLLPYNQVDALEKTLLEVKRHQKV